MRELVKDLAILWLAVTVVYLLIRLIIPIHPSFFLYPLGKSIYLLIKAYREEH